MGLRTALGLKPPTQPRAPSTKHPMVVTDDIGQEFFDGCKVLCDRKELLRRIPSSQTAAEIGVAFGDFSSEIWQINQPAKLYLIDCWGSDRYSPGREAVQSTFRSELMTGHVEIVDGLSQDILPNFQPNSFDWVYLDTTHQYRQTAIELQLLEPLIKNGGRIAGHDFFNRKTYGVVASVLEFCKARNWHFEYITIDGDGAFSFCIKRA